jgi:hypothetical protein
MAYHDAKAAVTAKEIADKLWQDAVSLATGKDDDAARSDAAASCPNLVYPMNNSHEHGTPARDKCLESRGDSKRCGLNYHESTTNPILPATRQAAAALSRTATDGQTCPHNRPQSARDSQRLPATDGTARGQGVCPPPNKGLEQGTRGTSSRRQRRPTSAPERAESVCNGRDSPRPTMSSHLQTGHTPTSDQPPANPLRAGAAIANVPHSLKHPTAARCAPPSWPEVLSVPSPASGGRKERAQPYGARLDRSGVWDNAGAVGVPENCTLCPWLQQNMGLDAFNVTEYSISSE